MATTVIPIFPSRSFDATQRFYAELGFTESGRWPSEYLILRSEGGMELHFWFSHSAEASGCYVRCDSAEEVRSLHAEWDDAGAGPMEETDYDMIEFAVADPDGNQIRVGASVG